MYRKNAPNRRSSIVAIYISFFLLLSIPLVIWGTQSGSFDIRNRAFDDITVSDENPCVISLPNVNPYTLDVGKSITVQVDAKLTNGTIASLSITDSTGASIYQEAFDNSPLSISTSFKFTPQKSGTVDMLGSIAKVEGGSVACKISSTYDVLGLRAMAGNQAPAFTSLPTASKPSQDIRTGDDYEYTLTATDADGDRINYSYSFTPKADWLKPTIVQDGSKGTLVIKFQGSTTKAASYLANVFIHDGYSKHLSSQAWVISVSPAENDIPIVRILKPTDAISINSGDVVRVTWDASDLNLITGYSLYLSQNPTDESSWIAINDNISAKTTSYSIDTSNLNSGTYKIIVKATDNQSPALSGLGISEDITVNGGNNNGSDDVVVIGDPQVINMTPISTDTINNKQVMIKATLIAGENSEINTKSIVFKLDDADISDQVSLNKISTQEATVIYQPESDLSSGLHKVEITFNDQSGKSVTKSWTFTIASENTVDQGYVSIFGLEVSQRTLIIIGVGILVVIIAIVAPIIVFSVWKEEQKKQDDEEEGSYIIPTMGSSSPIPPMPTTENIVENIPIPETEQPKSPQEDVWNNYSAPTPAEEVKEPVTEPQVARVEEVPKQEILQPVEAITVPTPEPEQPVVEKKTTDIPTPETTETSKESEISTSTPTQAEEMPTVPQTIAPPEPDIVSDTAPDDDLLSLYDQIQQAQTEDNDTQPSA